MSTSSSHQQPAAGATVSRQLVTQHIIQALANTPTSAPGHASAPARLGSEQFARPPSPYAHAASAPAAFGTGPFVRPPSLRLYGSGTDTEEDGDAVQSVNVAIPPDPRHDGAELSHDQPSPQARQSPPRPSPPTPQLHHAPAPRSSAQPVLHSASQTPHTVSSHTIPLQPPSTLPARPPPTESSESSETLHGAQHMHSHPIPQPPPASAYSPQSSIPLQPHSTPSYSPDSVQPVFPVYGYPYGGFSPSPYHRPLQQLVALPSAPSTVVLASSDSGTESADRNLCKTAAIRAGHLLKYIGFVIGAVLCFPCIVPLLFVRRKRKAATKGSSHSGVGTVAAEDIPVPRFRMSEAEAFKLMYGLEDDLQKAEVPSPAGVLPAFPPHEVLVAGDNVDSAGTSTLFTLPSHSAPTLKEFFKVFNFHALVDKKCAGVTDFFKFTDEAADLDKLQNSLDPWDLVKKSQLYRLTGYIALTPGTVLSNGKFIRDSDEKRIWHGDATWDKSVRGVNPVITLIPLKPELLNHGNEGHQQWRAFVALVLNRMLIVSAGLQRKGHESIHGIIALQTIREMLAWRIIIRNAARIAGHNSVANLTPFGEFRPTADGRISVDGNEIGDVEDLNPCSWKSARDISRGLLAWVSVRTDAVSDARSLLRAMDYSLNNVGLWCTSCLQFAAGRDFSTAEAFVGLARFMFVRQWLPSDDLAKVHLCANEFLSRAVAVPELEACLPEILGLEHQYKTGHDIDTGAVAVIDTQQTDIYASEAVEIPRDNLTARGVSLPGLPQAKDTRVVMSVKTNPPTGKEWQVPRVVGSNVDFEVDRKKYRLKVARHDVDCHRRGACTEIKRHVKRFTGVQAMGVGFTVEADVKNEPDASGATALSNALARAYGDGVCRHALSWLHRGMVQLSENCTAASFVPKSSLQGNIAVNQTLDFEICREMVFGRRGHELYWLPGEGLSCFRLRDSANGTYRLSEVGALPVGVEVCRAEISMNFG